MRDKFSQENLERCKYLAEKIDAIHDGLAYHSPDDYDDVIVVDDFDDVPADVDEVTLGEFLADNYNVEYRVGQNLDLRSVSIMLACGGPNIWVDTDSGCVELYWGTEHEQYPISWGARQEIEDYFSDEFDERVSYMR